jgi:Rrf2 family nitric oxide-sensitive transcriptional repressor
MLMHLAVNSKSLTTIAETADRYALSKNHLMKVAYLLGQNGFIETVRGRSGGLKLAMNPNDIILGQVVRTMEGDSIMAECFPGGKGECLITKECRLKSILSEAQTAFYDCLNQYTLADLVSENTGLESLLLEPI